MHWEDLNDDAPPTYSSSNSNEIVRNNISKYLSRTHISPYENDISQYLNYGEETPHYLNHYENSCQERSYNDSYNDTYNDIEAWNDLFGENGRIINRDRDRDNEQSNTADALIERSLLLNLTSITMNKTKFKKLSVPKSVKKLEKLKSLEISNSNIDEITYFPPNLEELKVTNCLLSLFEASNAPPTLTILSLENNLVELFLDGTFLSNLTEINLSSNKLKHIPILPESVEKLMLNSNEIEKIENLESLQNLKHINLGGNSIKVFENIPFTVEHINLNKNKIEFVDFTGFIQLKEFRAHSNEILFILSEFPENITYIDLSQNNVMIIPKIGKFIKYLDLSYNKLKKMPELESIKNLETFDITSNDDIELTDDTIRKLIEIKSNVHLCFFDQFKVEETVIEQERNSSDTSDSEDEYRQIIISSEDDNHNDITVEEIKQIQQLNEMEIINSIESNTIESNIVQENSVVEEKEVIKIKSKRININLKRSYDL